jgi:uncharacterized membrane protein
MTAPICTVCGTRAATHICQSCGRTVCGNCINPATWTCSACNARLSPETAPPSLSYFSPLSVLLFIASAAIFIGILLVVLGSLSNLDQGTSGGAIILIGPIPIVLGGGPNSLAIIAIGAVLTIVTVVFFLILSRRRISG